jgi:hypothetical protein
MSKKHNPSIQLILEHFWEKRQSAKAQQEETGVQGGAARSGGHMVAIQDHVRQWFIEAGLPEECVLPGSPSLPGFFRRSKSWDIVVVYKGVLVAAVELKSQVGSVGNNANNRIEEALGNALDVAAVQKNFGTFGPIPPWLGFVLVLEETKITGQTLKPNKTAFPVDPIFEKTTYSQQYESAISRFISEGLYSAGWFITTDGKRNGQYSYNEPLASATHEVFRGLIQARVDFVRSVFDQTE